MNGIETSEVDQHSLFSIVVPIKWEKYVFSINILNKIIKLTLARCLSWLERPPLHQKVVGLIPSEGTYLGSRFNPVGARTTGN